MSPDGITRSPVVALAAALVVLVVAAVASTVLLQLGVHGMVVEDPVSFLAGTLVDFVASLVRVGVLVGGVALALHLKRPGRALLVIAPVAFACFLALSLFQSLAVVFRSGGLAMALSGPVEQTALLVALTLVAHASQPRVTESDPEAPARAD